MGGSVDSLKYMHTVQGLISFSMVTIVTTCTNSKLGEKEMLNIVKFE